MIGSSAALRKHLPHAEIIFEFRNVEGAIAYQARESFRDGFIETADSLWDLINSRNDLQQYQEGLFKYPLRAFDEPTIREAVCNAICHRDYRDQGAVFVRQHPLLLSVESPGASVVPLEDMLKSSKPRNRRLAEAMERCGLVERSGQGIDLMYENCVKLSKPLPDWRDSDSSRVVVKIRGEISDPKIVRFFERLSSETLRNFSGEDFLTVDLVRRRQPLSPHLRENAQRLVRLGVMERAGPGFKLTASLLAEIETPVSEQPSTKAGDTALALEVLKSDGEKGTSVSDLMKFLGRTREQVRWVLADLRRAKLAHPRGRGAGARWFLGAEE